MTTKLLRPPLQREVKEAVKKEMENGDQKALAQLRRLDPSEISRYFNEDRNEFESAIWLAICEVCDGLNTRTELGEAWAAIFNRFVDGLCDQKHGAGENVGELWKRARRSAFEFLDDSYGEQPQSKQIRMAEKAETDIANYRRAILREKMVGGDYEDNVSEVSGRAS